MVTSICALIGVSCKCANAVSQDGGLYGLIIAKVDRFRELIGAPDTEKFNIVLLGGIRENNVFSWSTLTDSFCGFM